MCAPFLEVRLMIMRANGLTRRVAMDSLETASGESLSTCQCKHRAGLLQKGALHKDPRVSPCFPRFLNTTHLHVNCLYAQEPMWLSFPSDSQTGCKIWNPGDLLLFLGSSLLLAGVGECRLRLHWYKVMAPSYSENARGTICS